MSNTITIVATKGAEVGTVEIDLADHEQYQRLMARIMEQIIKPLEKEGWQVTLTSLPT